MADPARSLSLANVGDDPLVGWALGTFHTATLTVVPLGALYLDEAVGDLLAGLDTTVGLGLYLALWTVTWWTTRNVLRELDDGQSGEPETGEKRAVSTGSVLLVGGKWGGIDGVCFLWLLLGGFVASNLPSEIGRALEAVPFVLFAAAVGSVLALGIGGIIGVLFAALDVALFRVADRLVPTEE